MTKAPKKQAETKECDKKDSCELKVDESTEQESKESEQKVEAKPCDKDAACELQVDQPPKTKDEATKEEDNKTASCEKES